MVNHIILWTLKDGEDKVRPFTATRSCLDFEI